MAAYDPEESFVKNKLPRAYNYAQRSPNLAGMLPYGGGSGTIAPTVPTVAPNPGGNPMLPYGGSSIAARAGIDAQSNSDYAAAAPARRPEWFKAMLPGTEPGSMSITLDKGQQPAQPLPTDMTSTDNQGRTVISRQGTQRLQPNVPGIAPDVDQAAAARRGAYVNKQRNLANFMYPGMESAQFARDANTRANTAVAAGVSDAAGDQKRFADERKSFQVQLAAKEKENADLRAEHAANLSELKARIMALENERKTQQGDTRLQGTEDYRNAEETRKTSQGDRRLDQADKRIEQGDRRLKQTPGKFNPDAELAKRQAAQQNGAVPATQPAVGAPAIAPPVIQQPNSSANPAQVTSRADVDALPPGSYFKDPNTGIVRFKPKMQPTTQPATQPIAGQLR